MSYTVNKLAKLSGVSVRTLHYYDEIGLLKPSFYGENNYRYYKEEELLLLQQILFYRELGMPLNEIQEIIYHGDFNKIEALESHRNALEKNLDRSKQMIETINKTISHLRGQVQMKNEELYYGFDSEKQKAHEKHLVESGILTQAFIDESNKKIKNWTDKQKNEFIKDIEKIMNELIVAINNKLMPSSDEVQRLMQRHYTWLERTWTPTKESYIGLTELYQTPEFRVFYDSRHPKLLEFMIDAMGVFADKKLS